MALTPWGVVKNGVGGFFQAAGFSRMPSVKTTPFMSLASSDEPLNDRQPEAEGTVADGQRRIEVTSFHVWQQLPPRVLVLPVVVAEGDQLLLPLGSRLQQDQKAPPPTL